MKPTYRTVCDAVKAVCEDFEMDYENPNQPLPVLVINILAVAYARDAYNEDLEIIKSYFNNGCQ